MRAVRFSVCGCARRRQLSSAHRGSLHAVFVAVGGGGLVAGIAAYVKALHPGVKVIGVEPSGVL